MADNFDLSSTIAYLRSTHDSKNEPEPFDRGLPVVLSRNGPVITSFPTNVQEEDDSDSEDILERNKVVLDHEDLLMEIQRNCDDFSNQTIEECFAKLHTNSDVDTKASNDLKDKAAWQKLLEIRREFEESETEVTSSSSLTSKEAEPEVTAATTQEELPQQDELCTNTEREEDKKTDRLEDSPNKPKSAKSSRSKSKRRFNNAAIESILKFTTTKSSEDGAASSADTSGKISDGQNVWEAGTSDDRIQDRLAKGNISLIGPSCITGYSNFQYVSVENREYPVLSKEDFPPLK